MTSYIIKCSCDNSTLGIYSTLVDAQSAAQNLMDIYTATDPEFSSQNTATLYVTVHTRTFSRIDGGITLTSSNQNIIQTWKIDELISP